MRSSLLVGGTPTLLDFWKVTNLGETFEIVVLGPEGGFVGEGDCVNQRVGQGELVLDEEFRSSDGDFLVDGNDEGRTHRLGDFIGLPEGALLENDLADLREGDARDKQVGKSEENWAKMNRVGSIIETLQPSAGI